MIIYIYIDMIYIYIYTGHINDEMWWCIYNDFGFQQTHTYSQHPNMVVYHRIKTEEERSLQRPEEQDQEECHHKRLVSQTGTGTSGLNRLFVTGWEVGGSTSDIGWWMMMGKAGWFWLGSWWATLIFKDLISEICTWHIQSGVVGFIG